MRKALAALLVLASLAGCGGLYDGLQDMGGLSPNPKDLKTDSEKDR
jgi:hypothetical protein